MRSELNHTIATALLMGAVLTAGCAGRPAPAEVSSGAETGTVTVVSAADVEWQHLNPARGDASPAAATLWGDRNGTEPTGFLVRFVDGFESPPHIHNVSYRGVVIRGRVHNDDPAAAAMWMPVGSYWTQPQGGAHITAASGGETVAYIEIDQGPYLVRPVEQATTGAEHPVNVHVSNLVWLGFNALGWGTTQPEPRVAFLWGDPDADQAHGLLLRLPAGSAVTLRASDSAFRAVVIEGSAGLSGPATARALPPGSSLSARDGDTRIECVADTPCTWYVRAAGRLALSSVPP